MTIWEPLTASHHSAKFGGDRRDVIFFWWLKSSIPHAQLILQLQFSLEHMAFHALINQILEPRDSTGLVVSKMLCMHQPQTKIYFHSNGLQLIIGYHTVLRCMLKIWKYESSLLLQI